MRKLTFNIALILLLALFLVACAKPSSMTIQRDHAHDEKASSDTQKYSAGATFKYDVDKEIKAITIGEEIYEKDKLIESKKSLFTAGSTSTPIDNKSIVKLVFGENDYQIVVNGRDLYKQVDEDISAFPDADKYALSGSEQIEKPVKIVKDKKIYLYAQYFANNTLATGEQQPNKDNLAMKDKTYLFYIKFTSK